MKIDSVLKEVRKDIIPGKQEREELEEICEEILKIVNEKSKESITPTLCGSVEKGTWLKETKDIDLFLLFNKKVDKEKLEKQGLLLAKEIAKKLNARFEKAYAEHPYIKMEYRDHYVDLVPAYQTNPEDIKSSVDRTPHHVKYIKDNLPTKLRDESRFLKKFCKGIGVYGSDLKTRGFSGYLCELLVLKYKGFKNLLKNSSNWFPGKIIDLENYWQDKEGLREKFKSPLITIDPVDKNRNVSSVLHEKKFFQFIKKSKEFLKNPSKHFFFSKISRPNLSTIKKEIKQRKTSIIGIKFKKPPIHQDILYPQLRKFKKRITDELEEREFKTLNSGVEATDQTCYLILELEIFKLPAIEKREGPSIYDTKHSKDFLRRYKGNRLLLEDEKWEVEKTREFTNPKELLRYFLNQKKLKEKGIPNYLAKEIKKDFEVLSGERFWKDLKNKKDLTSLLNEIIEKSYR